MRLSKGERKMRFYDVMQLNAADSKQLLKQAETKKEKRTYTAAFILKNFLCILFCMGVVVSFSVAFGEENSIAGVVVLIAILAMRQVDLDIDPKQSLWVIMALFAILSVGPHLAASLPAAAAFGVNLLSLLLILILACHNMYLFNHAIFVLGYLLLMGYDVQGEVYLKRVISLLAGGAIVALIFYIRHRDAALTGSAADLFKDFIRPSERTCWQIKMALGVSSVLLLGSLLGLPRVMWAGFACMSLLQPLSDRVVPRLKHRLIGVICGSLLFGILYWFLPGNPQMYIGVLGGLAVGFSGTYGWQTVFNCLGALSMAVGSFGLAGAVILRIINNLFGIVYSFCFHMVFSKGEGLLLKEKEGTDVV